MTQQDKPAPARHPLTPGDLARMHGAVAIQCGGQLPKGSYIGRIQQHIAKTSSRTPSRGGSKR